MIHSIVNHLCRIRCFMIHSHVIRLHLSHAIQVHVAHVIHSHSHEIRSRGGLWCRTCDTGALWCIFAYVTQVLCDSFTSFTFDSGTPFTCHSFTFTWDSFTFTYDSFTFTCDSFTFTCNSFTWWWFMMQDMWHRCFVLHFFICDTGVLWFIPMQFRYTFHMSWIHIYMWWIHIHV